MTMTQTLTKSTLTTVAVGVVIDSQQRVLVARRPEHVHQGGFWEFPGGRQEPGETITDTLVREFQEELGITPTQFQPLINLRHVYADKQVALNVWRISEFQGEAYGKEGQPIEWRPLALLSAADFPAANRAIIHALNLPQHCAITPDMQNWTIERLSRQLTQILDGGIRLVQLRTHAVDKARYLSFAQAALEICAAYQARCLLNMPAEWLADIAASDLHLTSKRLSDMQQRPNNLSGWLSASCHNPEELKRAESLGVDFAFVSPVNASISHPDAAPLGWRRFADITSVANIPVYALGGLTLDDTQQAIQSGAQGVAGIRGFGWE